ncbi:MAG TPA: C4-type zinc ribbon domain-containing protein [Bryobacteraceae bacterium]|nr:C4-type zinc ribbon domain-containing protein [Bryobacteraceae bacterium]
MDADLRLAIQLQDLDIRINELQHEIASLPRHIASIEKTLEAHLRKVEADRAALAANQRERKKLEGDIQAQEARVSSLRNQMLGAKTNEQYGAFKNEIDFCQQEIRKFEDRILERMTESEALDSNLKTAEASLAEEKRHVEAEKGIARERTQNDQAELAALQKKRAEVVGRMAKPTYSNYERIRRGRRGIAVAEVVDNRCTACNMTVRLQFLQDLRLSEKIMTCESCGRILYYNPPVEVDEHGPSQASVETEA